MQTHFNPSRLFAPWLASERARKDHESHNQKQKRRSWKQRQPLQVKIGHGGTLDPLATGVLILGLGSGTKSLSSFLECTKSYETVLLFGAATDSYDTQGKIVARKPYGHVTRAMVEEKLRAFRGRIMQKPPIFSAKRIQGKRLYEYAREGVPLPEGYQIEECPVGVESVELTEWYEGGSHDFHWPEVEAEGAEKKVVDEVLHLQDEGNEAESAGGEKRKREDGDEEATVGGTVTSTASPPPSPKRARASPSLAASPDDPRASGALPKDPSQHADTPAAAEDQPLPTTESASATVAPAAARPLCPAPAARIRMTVTSGFYVRSLCHDLALACASAGCMASLVRTRQGEFELGVNTLGYEDLARGEEVWGPKVEKMLEEWRGEGRSGGVGGGGGGGNGGGPEKGKRSGLSEAGEVKGREKRNTSSPEGDD